MTAAIDRELRASVYDSLSGYPDEFTAMFAYQLGWMGGSTSQKSQGKRIRPLLVLLACHAVGGEWQKALPAAAAVELLHNFSLIHDDIQDHSDTRRGQPTVWVKWGEALAINAGDAMLTVSHLSLMRLNNHFNSSTMIKAVQILQEACLNLTRGQFLDISFEEEPNLPLDLYWQMIEGKTSSLLSACLALGTLLGGGDDIVRKTMAEFGTQVGLAFQVQDDYLGIWGDALVTGKSATGDLESRKKTYPVLLGIKRNGEFLRSWQSLHRIDSEKATLLAAQLKNEGVDIETVEKFHELYNLAFETLSKANLDENLSGLLKLTIESLFGRIH
jgi:geranylgeranyl diphosphate synthase type I